MYSVALASIVVLVSLLVDTHYFENIVKPDIQIVIGTLVVFIILFDNALTGLLLGIAVLIMYLRVYAKTFGIDFWNFDKTTKISDKYPMRSILGSYVTPEKLRDAQNNVIDSPSVDTPIIGIQEMYGFPVYSAQGIDKVMPGISSTQLYATPKLDGAA